MSDETMGRLGREKLRALFLFEALTDEQLDWLAEHGSTRTVLGGNPVFSEGEPATEFFVLLHGTVALSRRVRAVDTEVSRSSQVGAYGGATQAYLSDRQASRDYRNTMQAIETSDFFVLPAAAFAQVMREWFPMAMHLLEGLFLGMRNSELVVQQRERLAALGALSAGLTHELNNPAAAASRATATLRERVAGMRHKLAKLADGSIEPADLRTLTGLQEEIVGRIGKAPVLTPMQTADREDAIGDWLEAHGVNDGYEMAPTFVAAGVDEACLDELVEAVDESLWEGAFHWLNYALETELLMNEIDDATTRISSLVGAAKQYSQMDRAAHQWIDVHDGLISTLVMLTPKLRKGNVTVVKEFDRTLPKVPAYAGELNQVWTNIIDNACQAMGEGGTLTVRTSLDGECVLVEIGDTGPGIPADIQERIFEPFFTTKPVGEGTGLGLDISARIVTERHGGTIEVDSRPGDTRFRVRLPLTESADRAAAT